jgi:hypothetical protein
MEKFVVREEFILAELHNHFVVGTIVAAPATDLLKCMLFLPQ